MTPFLVIAQPGSELAVGNLQIKVCYVLPLPAPAIWVQWDIMLLKVMLANQKAKINYLSIIRSKLLMGLRKMCLSVCHLGLHDLPCCH